MSRCQKHEIDKVYKSLRVIVFPTTFVGLSSTLNVYTRDIPYDLTTNVYLKTRCDNILMSFSEARLISENHRAFLLSSIEPHKLTIAFSPTNECIARKRKNKNYDHIFMTDLRIMKACGRTRCCSDDNHSEVARLYFSGQYEYPSIAFIPRTLFFGTVTMNSTKSIIIEMKNNSHVLAAKVQYIKKPGFWVNPHEFTIAPNNSRMISVVMKPIAFNVPHVLHFLMINPHHNFGNKFSCNNALILNIKVSAHIKYDKYKKVCIIKSLNVLTDKRLQYAFTNSEMIIKERKKDKANLLLQFAKSTAKRKKSVYVKVLKATDRNFCRDETKHTENMKIENNMVRSNDFVIHPLEIDFKCVDIDTEKKETIIIENKTEREISFHFLNCKYILYTKKRNSSVVINVSAYIKEELYIFSKIDVLGPYTGYIEFTTNNNNYYKHPFKLSVENAHLYVIDKTLKFGMVTGDLFVNSAPIRIYNKYNIDLNFNWTYISTDIPFKVFPKSGSVPSGTFRTCDVVCTGISPKNKNYITLETHGDIMEIELIVQTRKVSVNFLKRSLFLREISLNMETTVNVILENTSKELTTYSVIEPLIVGLSVMPMSGNLQPKSVLLIKLTLKLPCVMEFNADLGFKINNKETIILSVNGSVLDPKITIQPKVINLPRIPVGMVTFIPIVIQNLIPLKLFMQKESKPKSREETVCSLCDFDIYAAKGNEMANVTELFIEGHSSFTIYLKIHETERSAYDYYLPLRLNELIGPPDPSVRASMDMQHFIHDCEKLYSTHPKIRIQKISRDIAYCKVAGVFSKRCLHFSREDFQIYYEPNSQNSLNFSITNVSNYVIPIAILAVKIKPYFNLKITSKDVKYTQDKGVIQFELDVGKEIEMIVRFKPPRKGKYTATADIYIDKTLSMPFHNLTFTGIFINPTLLSSISYICFGPASLGTILKKNFTLSSNHNLDKKYVTFKIEPPNDYVKITYLDNKQTPENNKTIEVEICISCKDEDSQDSTLTFRTSNERECHLMLTYCYTRCSLTLHANYVVDLQDNPYPFYPIDDGSPFAKYMDACVNFLERWMYRQGFRKELFPVIPETFNIIAVSLVSQSGGTSNNVTFLTFFRRIAGSVAKHLNTVSDLLVDNNEDIVVAIHDIYEEILHIIKRKGGILGAIRAKYLLSFQEFCLYKKIMISHKEKENQFDNSLSGSEEHFQRLNKQSWFDVILQCYKVFVLDCCNSKSKKFDSKNIQTLLIEWFQNVIDIEYIKLFQPINDGRCVGCCDKEKKITNLTVNMRDGIAFAAATLHFCPYFSSNLESLSKVICSEKDQGIVHNALLIIECWNQLKLNFPIESRDFENPNFLQMLFLSVHLYTVLPILSPRDILIFRPPLLRTSLRNVYVGTGTVEPITCTYNLLNDQKNCFAVEKNPIIEKDKRIIMHVKYTANFTYKVTSTLILTCCNKMRIFDTYLVFTLEGQVGSVEPSNKYRLNCPIYRPAKLDISFFSPFKVDCAFHLFLTEDEPMVPVNLDEGMSPNFLVHRVNLTERDMMVLGAPEVIGPNDDVDNRIILSVYCTSTRCGNCWIWFLGEAGEFCFKVTTIPRTDAPLETFHAKIGSWPIQQCSCGEECECYRTSILTLPFKNNQMLHTLRSALLEKASRAMMDVFDRHIETAIGRRLIGRLLEECGTDMLEVSHILTEEAKYKVTSRILHPKERVLVLQHHLEGERSFVVTVPITEEELPERFTLTLTSQSGYDVRTYRIFFYQDEYV